MTEVQQQMHDHRNSNRYQQESSIASRLLNEDRAGSRFDVGSPQVCARFIHQPPHQMGPQQLYFQRRSQTHHQILTNSEGIRGRKFSMESRLQNNETTSSRSVKTKPNENNPSLENKTSDLDDYIYNPYKREMCSDANKLEKNTTFASEKPMESRQPASQQIIPSDKRQCEKQQQIPMPKSAKKAGLSWLNRLRSNAVGKRTTENLPQTEGNTQ